MSRLKSRQARCGLTCERCEQHGALSLLKGPPCSSSPSVHPSVPGVEVPERRLRIRKHTRTSTGPRDWLGEGKRSRREATDNRTVAIGRKEGGPRAGLRRCQGRGFWRGEGEKVPWPLPLGQPASQHAARHTRHSRYGASPGTSRELIHKLC